MVVHKNQLRIYETMAPLRVRVANHNCRAKSSSVLRSSYLIGPTGFPPIVNHVPPSTTMTSIKRESSIDEPLHQRLLQKCTQNFTIDTLVSVLSHTLFNPGVAWMLVLCLRAQVTPTTDRAWIFTVAYAIFLTILFVARVMNQRIAYGIPRAVDASREVVLVTGGAGGLGLTIAQMYAMRGVSVAVLDILDCASIDIENLFGGEVMYLQCDVGDRAQVEDAKEQIEKEVRLCLLISCAFYW